MVGWHPRLNGHEFEQAPGDTDRQGGLECCSSWGHKESDRTKPLNNDNNPGLKWCKRINGMNRQNLATLQVRRTLS